MIYETYRLPSHGCQTPVLKTYILDKTDDPKTLKRTFFLVVPGGGYNHYGMHEQETIALKLNSLGFSAAIIYYSLKPVKFPEPLLDTAEAVAFIRKNADSWFIDKDKIVLIGFSAGGHAAASLGAYWDSPLIKNLTALKAEDIKPNALVLSYPVITADENFCHRGSIECLLGNLSEKEKENLTALTESKTIRDVISIEKHITKDFPPPFIWHTLTDETVPAENTILLISALKKNGIDFEYHLFSRGRHGLALSSPVSANAEGTNVEKECEVWPELMLNWLTARGF